MREHFVAASTVDLTAGGDRISATFLSKQHHYINVTDRQGVPSPTKNDRPGAKTAENVPGPTFYEVRPFCWTDLTIRDNGLSSVLYRTHSV